MKLTGKDLAEILNGMPEGFNAIWLQYGGKLVELINEKLASKTEQSWRCMEPAGQAMSPFHWFCCVLPKGHAGEHRKGGQCTVHGEYVGDQCPQWPECVKRITEAQFRPAAPHGECSACNMGQDIDKGEGTHLEGTRQHPALRVAGVEP